MELNLFPAGDVAPSAQLQVRPDDSPSFALLKLIYEKQYYDYNHLDATKATSGLRTVIPKVFPNETYDDAKPLRPMFIKLIEDKTFLKNQFLVLSNDMLRMFVADDFDDVLFDMFVQLNQKMGCDQNKFQMTMRDVAMLHCSNMEDEGTRERVFEYFQSALNQTREAVDRVVFKYVFPAPLLLLPTVKDNPKAQIMSALNTKSLLSVRTIIDFFLNGYDGEKLCCSLRDVMLLQSQIDNNQLYQLCEGFIDTKTTVKLGELCKALAHFLHSQKPYEYVLRLKGTQEKLPLTNFLIIKLLKENATGCKLEKLKNSKMVDYGADLEQVCTPTQNYPLLSQNLNDSGEVRLFKLFMTTCEQFHLADAAANRALLKALTDQPSLVVPEALQKQLCSILQSYQTPDDYQKARSVISQVFKFYKNTTMVKLIVPLCFLTASEAFQTQENLFQFAQAMLSAAQQTQDAGVTAGTVIICTGLCELANQAQRNNELVYLLQLELFDRLDDFETEEPFAANTVKKMTATFAQFGKSYVCTSKTSLCGPSQAAYPGIKSPSLKSQGQDINFSQFDAARTLHSEQHQIQSDEILRIVTDLEQNLNFHADTSGATIRTQAPVPRQQAANLGANTYSSNYLEIEDPIRDELSSPNQESFTLSGLAQQPESSVLALLSQVFDDISGNVSPRDLNPDEVKLIKELSLSCLRLRKIHAFLCDNYSLLTTSEPPQLNVVMGQTFEQAYKQFGKKTVQQILISALVSNYENIEVQFLDYLKDQFKQRMHIKISSQRAELDEKYYIDQTICPGYLFLVFCVFCNLSGFTQYQNKFSELLQAQTAARQSSQSGKGQKRDDDNDGQVLSLQQALTLKELNGTEDNVPEPPQTDEKQHQQDVERQSEINSLKQQVRLLQAHNQSMRQTQQDIGALQNELASAKELLYQWQQKYNELEAQIAESKKERELDSDFQQRADQLTHENQLAKQQIRDLQQQIDELHEEKAATVEQYEDRIQELENANQKNSLAAQETQRMQNRQIQLLNEQLERDKSMIARLEQEKMQLATANNSGEKEQLEQLMTENNQLKLRNTQLEQQQQAKCDCAPQPQCPPQKHQPQPTLDLKVIQRLNKFINSTEQMQDVTHNSEFTREAVAGSRANQQKLFRELVEINDDLLTQIGLEKAQLRWLLKNNVYMTSGGRLRK